MVNIATIIKEKQATTNQDFHLHMLNRDWSIRAKVIGWKPFLAHLAKGHVSFCHQVSSVVCR
jgi:hypothetical protein